jgi:hypothetical protein
MGGETVDPDSDPDLDKTLKPKKVSCGETVDPDSDSDPDPDLDETLKP